MRGLPDRVVDQLRRVKYEADRLDRRLTGADYIRSGDKRFLDKLGAGAMLPFALPLMALSRLAVRVEDGGPTIVELPRVGLDGRQFMQKKIRSMKPGSEKDPTTIALKDPNDERITVIGGILRVLSIDELPQLRNVLDGDMSLVGPRPVSPMEHRQMSENDSDYELAYNLGRPGLTGPEQINGRGALSADDRIGYTLEYGKTACLVLDLEIIAKTTTAVINRDGAY